MKPESEIELAEMITISDGPLRVVGGGTRGLGDAIPGETLETSGLDGIRLYDPGALTIVVGAGTPLSTIEKTLAAEGQYLPFEPVDYCGMMGTKGTATIGGVVASNNSGSRRIQSGAARDYMLGVRFVDGRGQILKNGGRVMKNVTGYDLVKLMSGSFGTLGVISEVALKVLPIPQTQAVVTIEGLDDCRAVAALAKALGSPFDVTGAAHLPQGLQSTPLSMIRIEGFEKSVSYRAEQLVKLLAEFDATTVETDPKKITKLWCLVRDGGAFSGISGDIWRISVRPSDGPDVVKKLNPQKAIYDWGGGLVWAMMPEGTDARGKLENVDGHATLIRASKETRQKIPSFQPESAPIARLSQGLRNKFDPRGILNAGLMDWTEQ